MSSVNQIRSPGVQVSGPSDGGGGGGGAANFSYKYILLAETITIPARQQMIVYGGLENAGTLIISGELCLLPIPLGGG